MAEISVAGDSHRAEPGSGEGLCSEQEPSNSETSNSNPGNRTGQVRVSEVLLQHEFNGGLDLLIRQGWVSTPGRHGIHAVERIL